MSDMKALGDVPGVGDMELDLTKDERLRAAALIMAIRYHVETIVKDAAMYQAMMASDKHLEPTTVDRVVLIAEQFERFLLGGPKAAA